MTKIKNKKIWKIIESYFDGKRLERLVRHQVESYNYFVQNEIQKTINMFNPVKIVSPNDYFPDLDLHNLEIVINFSNFSVNRPLIHENTGANSLMYPREARLRNFSYTVTMITDVDIQIIRRHGEQLQNSELFFKKMKNIHIGKLPVMLKSNLCLLFQHPHLNSDQTGECKFDPGGYFIINGSEKTVLGQEHTAPNKIYCFPLKKNNKILCKTEIKSVPDYKCISPKHIQIFISTKKNIFGYPMYVEIPRIKNPIPIFILFRVLNINSDKEICKYIVNDLNHSKKILSFLKASIKCANKYNNYTDALNYIMSQSTYTPLNMTYEAGMRKKKKFTLKILNEDLFPHCYTIIEKRFFLGYMIKKTILYHFGYIPKDDRDSYCNKRIKQTGSLLNNLFRNYFNKLVKDMQKQIRREINVGSWKCQENYLDIINYTNIYKIIKSSTLTNGLKRALATGDFGIKSLNSNKVGVAQVLNRLTYISSLSHLRRINTPIDKSGKLIPPRKLHNTQWGYICPAESPEGQSVGVVKNLSYLTHLTLPSESYCVYSFVDKYIIKLSNIQNIEALFNKVKLIINGNWVGIVPEPEKLFLKIKKAKQQGIINIYNSIIFKYKEKEIIICTEGGRLSRPVFKITEDFEKKISLLSDKIVWSDLINQGIIEYIDPCEQNNSLIAMNIEQLESKTQKYTHMEIHPSTIFGILASCIPFPDHNQSPRNTYQCAMGKQAIGIYTTNYETRFDKTSFVLSYPMRPFVDTRLMNILQINNIPSGENVIIAIASFTGYNQEDSIIMNQGAIDRGLFSATVYRTYKDEDKKTHGDAEMRCKPNRNITQGMNFGNYNKLNSNGIIQEDTLLHNKDIIIGKIIPIKRNIIGHTDQKKYLDQSIMYRTAEKSYIDKNYIQKNGDGYTFCKVKIRTFRKPTIGDKFSSRHGQKGTIGMILPAEDMPFTADGIRPDIIINPHAIPSRMTIGQLKETVIGKLIQNLGLFGDGTSFNKLSLSFICDQLQKNGYNKYSNHILYNGMTGEQIQSQIFMGPVFYQRLKHMVLDKQHSRSIGPMVILTRQPAEGRARDGGLRFGEMERDCMISHGASSFTKERIYDLSDKFQVYICRDCGFLAIFNNKEHIHLCNECKNRTNFALCKIPYTFKLLIQELITMNVLPRLITTQNEL